MRRYIAVSGGVCHELSDAGDVQSAQREALDSAITAQVSEDLAQRMAAIEVGVAIGNRPPAGAWVQKSARRDAAEAASASLPSADHREPGVLESASTMPRAMRRRHRRGDSAPFRDPTSAEDRARESAERGRGPDASSHRHNGRAPRGRGWSGESASSASTNGWKATPRSSSQRPKSTMPPPSCTWRANSAERRVFPIPASPEMSTVVRSPADACFHASRSAVSCVERPENGRGAWVASPAGNGTVEWACSGGSHPTIATGTGSGRPLSSRSPPDVKLWPPRPRARTRTRSATRIWPPIAAAQRREASTTGVPKQSLSSRVTSPAEIPIFS